VLCWCISCCCCFCDDQHISDVCHRSVNGRTWMDDTKTSSSLSEWARSAISSAPSSSPFAILAKKVLVALLVLYFATDGNFEISATRQQPVLCRHFFHLITLLLPTEYTSSTCAKRPSNALVWATN
jgi:hypothetical protein